MILDVHLVGALLLCSPGLKRMESPPCSGAGDVQRSCLEMFLGFLWKNKWIWVKMEDLGDHRY